MKIDNTCITMKISSDDNQPYYTGGPDIVFTDGSLLLELKSLILTIIIVMINQNPTQDQSESTM